MNTAVDVVTCEPYFFQNNIFKYLDVKANILSLVDPNHNPNNYR